MTNLRKVITNERTNFQIIQAIPNQKEIKIFDRSVLVSETNTEGLLVYTNRRYMSLSGFSEEELIGSSYKIVRHPDMPRGVFKAMKIIINAKKIWRGYIKHLSKDGSFFWTLSYVQAKLDENDNIIGYISTGKVAYIESKKEAEKKYKERKSDAHLNDKYFMISESYYEMQILRKNYMHECIEEAKHRNNRIKTKYE